MQRFGLALVSCALVAAVACADDTSRYDITVRFNTSATEIALRDAGNVLKSYDRDVDFLIQESFPPTGVALVETDVPDFCRVVEIELAGRPSVDGVACGPARDDASGDGDTPVSYP